MIDRIQLLTTEEYENFIKDILNDGFTKTQERDNYFIEFNKENNSTIQIHNKHNIYFWHEGMALEYNLNYYDKDYIEKQKKFCYLCQKYVDEVVLIGFAGRCCPACRKIHAPRIEFSGWCD